MSEKETPGKTLPALREEASRMIDNVAICPIDHG
jgi:hypothetical protein